MRGASTWLWTGLITGALVRAWLLPVPGSPDVGSWKIWAVVGSRDPAALYGVGGSPPQRRRISWNGMSGTTEYPPAALYEMAAVGAVYRRLDPTVSDSPTFTALIKVPGIVAELAFVGVLLALRHRLGAATTWIVLAFWLNPAVIVNGAGLGYLDAQMAIPATIAVVLAGLGFPMMAGAAGALAVLTKAQALFVLPAVGLAALAADERRGRTVARLAAGAAVMTVALVGPIVVRGAWSNMLQALARLGAHDMVSGQGVNAWWIVTWLIRATYAIPNIDWYTAFTMPVRILGISRMVEVGYPNPRPIGAVVVVALIAWGTWRSRTGAGVTTFVHLAAWSVLAYFLFSAQVHENHAYLAVPLLAVAAGMDRRVRPAFWVLSTIVFLNMYLFYGLGDGRPLVVGRGVTVVDATVLLAFANLGLFAWLTRRLGRPAASAVSVGRHDAAGGPGRP